MQQKQFNYNEYFSYQLENFAKFESLLNYKNNLYQRFKQRYTELCNPKSLEQVDQQYDEISDYFKPAQVKLNNVNVHDEDSVQSTEEEFGLNDEQEFNDLDKALQEELNLLYNDYNNDDNADDDQQNEQEINYMPDKEPFVQSTNQLSEQSVDTQSEYSLPIDDDTIKEIGQDNQQDVKEPTKQPKKEKRKEKRRKDLTDQECYQKFSELLQQEISDFDVSNDDSEFKREKKIDYVAGKLISNNVWTNQQVQILKAYVYYIQSVNGRLHFGPLVNVVKKSKKQIWKKYNQIYTAAFTEEETLKLVQLVSQHMKEHCYVDFASIAGTLGKNALNSIHQYCMYMETHWDSSFDQKIIDHLKLQVTSPPFLGLIAYELGIYETAIKRRAERLGVFQPKQWTDDEDRLLRHFWENRANKKEAKKADILDALPDRYIFDIRKRLKQLGLDVNRVLWV